MIYCLPMWRWKFIGIWSVEDQSDTPKSKETAIVPHIDNMHDIRNNQAMVTNKNNLRSISASKSQSSTISNLTRSSSSNGQFCQKRNKDKLYYVEDLK